MNESTKVTTRLRPVDVYGYVKGMIKPGKSSVRKIGTGVFIGWGIDFMDMGKGAGQYTVALIEMPNGQILIRTPAEIRFKDNKEQVSGGRYGHF